MNPVPQSIAVIRSAILPLVLSVIAAIIMPKPLDFKGSDEYTYRACASMPAEAGLRAGSQGTNNLLLVMPKSKQFRVGGPKTVRSAD